MQLGYMQACTSLQTDNHITRTNHSVSIRRMPFLLPNHCNGVKALKQSIMEKLYVVTESIAQLWHT